MGKLDKGTATPFRYRSLGSSFVSDILDQLGIQNSVLRLSPVFDGAAAVGPAMPVRVQTKPNAPVGSREAMMNAVDASSNGGVLVISSDTSSCSAWGELTSTYAKLKGIAGVVISGAVRDTPQITKLRLPVFSSDRTPLSGYNRVEVVSIGDPIECSHVHVDKNDLVVADQDGVVFVPRKSIEEVVRLATKLSAKEKHHTDELRKRSRRTTQ